MTDTRSSITGQTRVLAILADPIAHVKAPPLINAIAVKRGKDAVMVPLQVAPKDLPQAFEMLRKIKSFDGGIITVPHKNAALALCDEVSPRAQLVGAINVIQRSSDGRILGDVLDGIGFMAGLKAAGHQLQGKRVFLAGAGGAAKAIAEACGAEQVARVTIYNRTTARAQELCDRLATAYPDTEFVAGGARPLGEDIVINGTSLGMNPQDALPLDPERLTPAMVVAEVIMVPEITPLLAAAQAKGCRLQLGKPMLDHQAELMSDFFRL